MKTALKWAMIAAWGLAALAILILLVLPFFFNAEKYKALLENKVSAMTGRSFSVGGDVALSFFPFVGASFSDLRLGNPTGFETTEFLSIKSFEVRVKLLPLLSRDVQVKRFVVDEPQIVLTKDANGRGNWQFDEKGAETEAAPSEPATPAQETAGELPIRSLAVADFSVSNGSIVWFDNATGERQAIDQLDVTLTDLSFDRPVGLSLSARKDDKPIAANGTVGPIGRNPQKAPIPLELKIEALSELAVTLNGTLASLAEAPRSDLAVTVSEFSPRKLLAKLGPPERIETADAGVLNKLSLKADVDAGPQAIIVSNGTMMLDDSTMTFKARIADFSRPDIAFEADLDRIDLDRYRPPKSTETVHGAPEQPPRDLPAKDASQTNGRKGENNRDLAALRRLLLDAALTIGEMTVNKARLSNCRLQVRGQDGVFSAAPLQADLYGGRFNLNGEIAVSQDPARSKVAFQLEGVQAGPLLQDQLGKNILDGRRPFLFQRQ
jgi:AsmA protein